MPRSIWPCQLAAFVAVTILANTPAVAQQQKPNVVFILADNVGYGDLGPYGGGELRGAPTPRIDQLARGLFGWVSGPTLKVVEEYLESVKKHPNPPAPNITRFGGGLTYPLLAHFGSATMSDVSPLCAPIHTTLLVNVHVICIFDCAGGLTCSGGNFLVSWGGAAVAWPHAKQAQEGPE